MNVCCNPDEFASVIEETVPDASRCVPRTGPPRTALPVTGLIISQVDILYIGTHFRLVALPNGAAREVLNSQGIWIREGDWTEP